LRVSSIQLSLRTVVGLAPKKYLAEKMAFCAFILFSGTVWGEENPEPYKKSGLGMVSLQKTWPQSI